MWLIKEIFLKDDALPGLPPPHLALRRCVLGVCGSSSSSDTAHRRERQAAFQGEIHGLNNILGIQPPNADWGPAP